MGFWESANKVYRAVNERCEAEVEKRDRAFERAERLSRNKTDKQVYDRYKNTHGYERAGYAEELRRRGYGND